MLQGIVWILGFLIAAVVVMRVCELAVFGLFLFRFQPREDEPRAHEVGLLPLTALPGVAQQVPQEFWPVLEGAHKRMRDNLGNAGVVLGLLTVAGAYGLLVLLEPRTSLAYWGLFAFPMSSYAKIGARGLRIDFLLVGHVAAVFKQLFYSSFTSFSFVGVLLVLVLRWFRLLP